MLIIVRASLLNMANCKPTLRQYSLQKSLSKWPSFQFFLYQKWHTRVTLFLVQYNHQLVSPFFFAFILAGIPFSASHSCICTTHQSLSFLNIRWCDALHSFCAGVALSALLIRLNSRIYSSKGELFHVINQLRQTSVGEAQDQFTILYIMEATTYYEILHRRRKRPLAMSAGILGVFASNHCLSFYSFMVLFLCIFSSRFLRKYWSKALFTLSCSLQALHERDVRCSSWRWGSWLMPNKNSFNKNSMLIWGCWYL